MKSFLSLLSLVVMLGGGAASARGEQGQLRVAKAQWPLLGDKPSQECSSAVNAKQLRNCVDWSSHDKFWDDTWATSSGCRYLMGVYVQCELSSQQKQILELQRQIEKLQKATEASR